MLSISASATIVLKTPAAMHANENYKPNLVAALHSVITVFAVDTDTDEKIRSALDRDLGGATTLIISHRIATLLDCDNILVLEKGRVSQLGSPKELLAQPGIFRKIYDMQMSIGEEEGA